MHHTNIFVYMNWYILLRNTIFSAPSNQEYITLCIKAYSESLYSILNDFFQQESQKWQNVLKNSNTNTCYTDFYLWFYVLNGCVAFSLRSIDRFLHACSPASTANTILRKHKFKNILLFGDGFVPLCFISRRIIYAFFIFCNFLNSTCLFPHCHSADSSNELPHLQTAQIQASELDASMVEWCFWHI